MRFVQRKKIIGSLEELKKLSKKSGNKYILMRHGQAEHNVLDVISCDKNNSHHLTEIGKKAGNKNNKALRRKK